MKTSLSPQVGIDTSELRLDVSIDGARSVPIGNSWAACEELAKRLPFGSVIHIESSGGYERTAVRCFRSMGFEVRVHDPLRVRRLAQARLAKAKTDALDAKALAEAGALLPTRPSKSPERESLADISRAISEFKKAAAQFKRRARLAELAPQVKKAYLDAAKDLGLKAKELEREFAAQMKGTSVEELFKLATSVPGIGVCTARVCVSELPEDFKESEATHIASYAGLAPIDNSSGKRTGRARLGRGNARLKAALYMPAVASMRSQPWAKDLYARLRMKGRSHQQAIVAVMRRLLIRIVAVLKRGSPWKDEPVGA